MSKAWLYTSFVLMLFIFLVVGIPGFPALLSSEIPGVRNLGTLVFLLLHLGTPALAFFYLKRRESS